MKQINSKTVTVSMVIQFTFTAQEADEFLAAPSEDKGDVMQNQLSRKHPDRMGYTTHIIQQYTDAIGKAMVQWRENELKQLPEYTQGERS